MTFTFNPVALKELRQLTRTNIISLILFLYPLVLLVVALFCVDFNTPPATALLEGQGKSPFAAVIGLTGFIAMIIIPLSLANKTAKETTQGFANLEFITALTPAQIITGKLLAAAILAGALIAVSMPFLAFAYLLRGIPLLHVFLAPFGLFLASLTISAVGLPVATMPGLSVSFRTLGLVGLCILIFALIGNLSFSSTVMPTPSLLPYGIAVFVAVAIILLARAIAATHLSPPHIDFEGSLRKTYAVIFLLSAGLLFYQNDDFRIGWVVVWTLLSLFLFQRNCFLLHPMPRVVRAKAPQHFLTRLLAYPFASGPYAGQIFSLILIALSLALFVLSDTIRHDGIAFPIFVLDLVMTIALFSSCARTFHSERIMNLSSIGVIVWAIAVNVLGTIGGGESFCNVLPCNIIGSGRSSTQPVHLLVSTLFLFPAFFLTAAPLFREFKSFRRRGGEALDTRQ